MEKEDGNDPMAYLKMMRLKTAEILDQLDGTQEHVLTARRYAEEDEIAEPPKRDAATLGDLPPEGLSPEEEVEWWRQKVAALSVDIGKADEKSSYSEERSSKSAKDGATDSTEFKKAAGSDEKSKK